MMPTNQNGNYIGEQAPRDMQFCPLSAVAKFPYKFIKGADSEKVSKAYFAEGKFHARGWTLYYIHTLLVSSPKPLILVPAADVEAFILEINKNLKIRLRVPNEPGFLISFREPGSPSPRYLGKLSSKEELSVLENKIPGPEFRHEAEGLIDLRTLSAFKDKIQLVIDAGKRKSKLSKGKKGGNRNDDGVAGVTKDSCSAQLEKTYRYFGLDKITNDLSLQGTNAKTLNSNSFHENVIFISIDVEAYERSRGTITEIGISTLDTNDLLDLAPGRGGAEWIKKMRSRHFRIKESSHLENHDFVTGCADKFEKRFGTSEWISIKDAPQVVASCFKYPFSALGHRSQSTEINQTEAVVKRNIVLVGHGVRADIDYFRSMGYNVANVDNLLEAVDTADLDRAISHQKQSRKLGTIVAELGDTPWNLHNAGNDAAYTLEALIGLCFKSLEKEAARKDRGVKSN